MVLFSVSLGFQFHYIQAEFEQELRELPCSQVLIGGDSHGQSIWVESGVNISRPGDPLVMQLTLLDRVLNFAESECSYEHAVIGVGPQNFSRLPVLRIEANQHNWFESNLRRLLPVRDEFNFSGREFASFFRPLLHLHSEQLDATSYQLMDGCDLSPEQTHQRLERHMVAHEDWFVADEYTTLQVEAQMKKLASAGLNVTLVGTPLHPSYLNEVGCTGWEAYQAYLRELSAMHGVTYLSLEQSCIPDSFFYDADHLGKHGVAWLSDTLQKFIAVADPPVK